jgi:hypothetical protein
MRGLKGKTAIVAGAAPGNIGGATALRLAQEGMKVVAADLNEAAAQAVVDEIKSARGYAIAKGFDRIRHPSSRANRLPMLDKFFVGSPYESARELRHSRFMNDCFAFYGHGFILYDRPDRRVRALYNLKAPSMSRLIIYITSRNQEVIFL